jgi:hypothetical protein
MIPASGTYQLLVARSPIKNSFGTYRLLIGLDAPEVLTGEAEPTGDEIATLDEEMSSAGRAVQEITGTITIDEPHIDFTVRPLSQVDTFYAFVEATSGNLTPVLVLKDSGAKRLGSANLSGEETSASLDYALERNASDYTLRVRGNPRGGPDGG